MALSCIPEAWAEPLVTSQFDQISDRKVLGCGFHHAVGKTEGGVPLSAGSREPGGLNMARFPVADGGLGSGHGAHPACGVTLVGILWCASGHGCSSVRRSGEGRRTGGQPAVQGDSFMTKASHAG